MNPTRKIIAAVLAVLTLGVFAAQTAGALGTPWYCQLPMTSGPCWAGHTGREIDRKAGAVADAAGTAYGTGEAAGRVVVNGTELAGTILEKTADATAWANDQAKRLPVPQRSLQPGECVTTSAGQRYCLPDIPAGPTPTTTAPRSANPLPVGTCVLDSNGRKWCVTS
ncbi:MAG: hypothetical protein AB7W59_31055 [Acidimicrobiia bacterium]